MRILGERGGCGVVIPTLRGRREQQGEEEMMVHSSIS